MAAQWADQQPGVRLLRARRAGCFLTDAQWRERWLGPRRCYVVAKTTELARFTRLAGEGALFPVAESGGKMVLTNQPLTRNQSAWSKERPFLRFTTGAVSSGTP